MRQKVAALIVRLRIPLMILMLILAVLCGTTIRSVKVNYDLISYLDDDTAAMRGLAIMNSEFSGVSGMSVALKNGTEEDAQQTASWIAALDGVMLANHDAETGVKEHDGGTYRLIRVIANADNSDAVYDAIEAQLADTPHLISGGPKDNRLLQQNIGREMPIVMLVSCIIVLAVLLAMSRSWLEPFIFFLIIAVSILLNMGTNWIFPSISFVTFAVAAILQLALAMDYSIMLINAFERLRAQGLAPREAMTQALADSFMPIASSALTSVAGMLALVFMSFTIGFDIGIVLAKGIVLSMLTVFLLMPGVLVACSPLLDKTAHKPPHISGKLITRGARGVVPILLIALIVAGTILQFGNTYTYTVRDMDADSQLVSELFGQNNQIVLLFPTDTTDEGYQRQRDMLAEMQAIAFDGAPIVNSVQAMVTTGAQALEYYDVPKAAQLLGYSEQQVQMVFNQLGVTDNIRADALIERLISLAKRFSMLVPKAAMEQLNQAETLLNTANSTFNGAHYARALLSLNLAISSPYAHDAVQQIEAILYKYYGEAGALLHRRYDARQSDHLRSGFPDRDDLLPLAHHPGDAGLPDSGRGIHQHRLLWTGRRLGILHVLSDLRGAANGRNHRLRHPADQPLPQVPQHPSPARGRCAGHADVAANHPDLGSGADYGGLCRGQDQHGFLYFLHRHHAGARRGGIGTADSVPAAAAADLAGSLDD